MEQRVRELGEALARARRVVVMTGAGISAESGIATFRSSHGTMAGLWKDFDAARLATPEAFAADPETVTRWYDWRRLGCLAAEPNAGHTALARLEQAMGERVSEGAEPFVLLTQNVDRLHQKAGSRRVVELHGNIMTWRCTRTGRECEPGPEPFARFPPSSPFYEGALLRPNVVWFGEMLPPEAVEAAQRAVARCDVFVSIGTSSVVHPAAGFIREAARLGAWTAEINPEATPISNLVECSIRGRAGEVLPRVC